MRATTRGSAGIPASILCSLSNGLCVSTLATPVGLDVSPAQYKFLPPPAPPLFTHRPSSCGSSKQNKLRLVPPASPLASAPSTDLEKRRCAAAEHLIVSANKLEKNGSSTPTRLPTRKGKRSVTGTTQSNASNTKRG
ncbi:hypothetical protein TcG_10786 [Trypanosoma cruzi]|nr:hypothetical protein TcG_10786 [Trypanosoma cruzi]